MDIDTRITARADIMHGIHHHIHSFTVQARVTSSMVHDGEGRFRWMTMELVTRAWTVNEWMW
jgi:hypothetical protein